MTDPFRAALLREQFGPIPWSERYKRPSPPPQRRPRTVVRVDDPPEVTAARRKVLAEVPWRETEAA